MTTNLCSAATGGYYHRSQHRPKSSGGEDKLTAFSPERQGFTGVEGLGTTGWKTLRGAPRSWTERAYPKLISYNRVAKGGHFAAWEQPQLFADEIRAAFRSLR